MLDPAIICCWLSLSKISLHTYILIKHNNDIPKNRKIFLVLQSSWIPYISWKAIDIHGAKKDTDPAFDGKGKKRTHSKHQEFGTKPLWNLGFTR